MTVEELIAKADELASTAGFDPKRFAVELDAMWRRARPDHIAALALACGARPPDAHTIALFLDRLEERVIELAEKISA